MAGEVDMVRFGEDSAYAAQMLDWAKQSNSQTLRMCGRIAGAYWQAPHCGKRTERLSQCRLRDANGIA
ncbi:MAG: hypothetical protein IPG64_21305 [Haliea sp.]|nr:hypothetical protein [Haliea sp.]